MISTRHRFLYVHVPKTGGNSVQGVLAPHADDRVAERPSVGHVVDEDGTQGLDVVNPALGFTRKHRRLAEYRDRLGAGLADFLVVTSVRNPWDRAVSHTAFMTPGGLPEGPLPAGGLRYPEPISAYLGPEGDSPAIHAIRFEAMQDGLDALLRRLGLPAARLPHKNRSRRHRDWRRYYTDDTAAEVARRFADDIARFGYGFDGPG